MRKEAVRLGKAITRARERRHWSKADLARRAGVAPSYVTRIEQGKFLRPSVEQVKSIAVALGVSMADLTDPPPLAGVSSGIETELRTLFPDPEMAPLVAEILQTWARHDERTQRFLLKTMQTTVLEFPVGNDAH